MGANSIEPQVHICLKYLGLVHSHPTKLKKLGKDGGAQTCDWIPSLRDWESGCATARGFTSSDISEALVTLLVQPRI